VSKRGPEQQALNIEDIMMHFSKLLSPQSNEIPHRPAKVKEKEGRNHLVIPSNPSSTCTTWNFHFSLNASLIYARHQRFPYTKIQKALPVTDEDFLKDCQKFILKKSSIIIIQTKNMQM